MKIWELNPPGTLWATPGLLRDCFYLLNVSVFVTLSSGRPLRYLLKNYTLFSICYLRSCY